MSLRLALDVAPDSAAVSQSVARIGRFANEVGRDHLGMACELVAVEALANIVRHNAPATAICLRIRVIAQTLVMTLHDNGAAFDMASAPASLPGDRRAESGREIWLMHSLAQLRYRRHHGHNVHRFCIANPMGVT